MQKLQIFRIRLKETRQELGLSINKASKLIGVSPKTLSGWENKNIDLSSKYLIKIGYAYKVRINYLFGYDDKKRNDKN